MEKYILCESRLDFKYKMIFSKFDKDFVIIEGGFIKLMIVLIRKKSFYHIRYIKYRGKIVTVLSYLIIAILAKLSGSKIIWSCHNIYEHNFNSKRYNDFLRILLAKISYKIVVFHQDLKPYLPKSSEQKIYVASFGNYKEFIEKQTEQNKEFQQQYKNWLNLQNINSPDLVSISAAKSNSLDYFMTKLNDNYNFLVIAPNVPFNINLESNNIFIYNNSFVKSEIKNILRNSKNLIGIITHNNISVPTSIYLFASYGVPVIVIDINPLNSMVKYFGIGEIVKTQNDINLAIKKIKKNYNSYQIKCEEFISINSWDNSRETHKSIFK